MPVQSDSIIYCIKPHKNPRRIKIYSHISSIIPGKEFKQGTSDKAESETTNEQTRTSTNRREERKQNTFPTIINIYCTLHSKSHYKSYHALS